MNVDEEDEDVKVKMEGPAGDLLPSVSDHPCIQKSQEHWSSQSQQHKDFASNQTYALQFAI